MRRLRRHIGFLKEIDEVRFKRWLDRNAQEFLAEVGVGAGKVVLDFGCGSGTYTIPAARLVGDEGKVYALDVRKKALDEVEAKAK
ncbi:MAG: methylase involved in ubiquinone/menaquinone biosynthesis, partial [Candidatus Bathyarchaeota archaeon B24]